MSKQKIKVGLLCNNKMAVPTLMRLMREGALCGVATGDTDAEAMHVVRASCEGGERSAGSAERVPYTVITRKGHKQQLREWVATVGADVVFVMTFPYRIPGEVLAMPRLGFLNFHFGLLPEMRGADPIFECIRQRLLVVGATVHVMDEGLDTGPIVLREEFPLSPDFTYGMLSGQMAMLGEKQCGEALTLLERGAEKESGNESGERGAESEGASPRPFPMKDRDGLPEERVPYTDGHPTNNISVVGLPFPVTAQDESKAKYWPKVGEGEITIRWDKMNVEEIIALVRACNPIGRGVPTSINGWKIGVVDICPVNLDGDASAIAPGTIIAIDHQNGLIVCCLAGRAVKLEVVYTSEGYFPGYKIALFGVGQWGVFS